MKTDHVRNKKKQSRTSTMPAAATTRVPAYAGTYGAKPASARDGEDRRNDDDEDGSPCASPPSSAASREDDDDDDEDARCTAR